MGDEPRRIARYKNFNPKSIKIHPFRRIISWLAGCLPKSWRFFILGLPARGPESEIKSADAGMSCVADGIASRLGAHLNPSGTYIPNLTLGAGPFIETRILQKQHCFPRIKTVAGTAASLVLEGHVNYYRWLMETLPRMRFLKETQVSYDWIYACQREPFHRQGLELLGCDPAQIIDCEKVPYLRAGKLVVPRFVDESEEWIVPWLREQFLPHAKAQAAESLPRRIYIARTKAASRSVANREELLELLSTYGFVSVNVEDFDWKVQLALFKNAEAVVGPHGAGLANLVFCSAPALVLELMAENYPFTFYHQISRQLKLDHHLVSCRPLNASSVTTSKIHVPVDEVQKILKAALG